MSENINDSEQGALTALQINTATRIQRLYADGYCTGIERKSDIAKLVAATKSADIYNCLVAMMRNACADMESTNYDGAITNEYEFLYEVRARLTELSGKDYILANLKQDIALYVMQMYKAGWQSKHSLVWKKCSDDLPTEEVIALNVNTNSVMSGKLEKSTRSPTAYNCVDDTNSESVAVFINCTHYIPVSELLKLSKE